MTRIILADISIFPILSFFLCILVDPMCIDEDARLAPPLIMDMNLREDLPSTEVYMRDNRSYVSIRQTPCEVTFYSFNLIGG